MDVHNYHPVTKIYTESSEADLDPRETELNQQEGGSGEEVYLLPAHATFVVPPQIPPGSVAVFNTEDSTWAIVLKEAAPVAPGEAPPSLEDQQAMFVLVVDNEIDRVYADVIGNRAVEYMTAEFEAQSYLDSVDMSTGMEVEVPLSIQADMDAFHHTAEEAARSILAAADQWRAAMHTMRALRLATKARARNVSQVEDLAELSIEFHNSLEVIRSSLGVG